MPIAGHRIWTSPLMKKPSFRVTLWFNMNKYKNGQRDWYNQITERLYLGAIPLKSAGTSGHQGRLDSIPGKMTSDLGVTGVVSINEPFERVVTFTKEEWAARGVELKTIDCGDFNFVPSRVELLDAADFIKAKMDQGGAVYVHCKAGRTRSATVVATYLIVHCGHTGLF